MPSASSQTTGHLFIPILPDAFIGNVQTERKSYQSTQSICLFTTPKAPAYTPSVCIMRQGQGLDVIAPPALSATHEGA
jgi:hypothetical protein